jgi:hypothetical protein
MAVTLFGELMQNCHLLLTSSFQNALKLLKEEESMMKVFTVWLVLLPKYKS